MERALAIWKRRWILVTLVSGMAFTAAASLILALPDLYRATATVMVRPEQMPENFVRPAVTGDMESRLHSLSQSILSRHRLQELIDRFGLYARLSRRADAETVIQRLRRDIQFELKGVQPQWGQGTTIAFSIGYQGWDPRVTAQVANTLAGFFVEENEKNRRQQAADTAGFLRAQLHEVGKALRAQEQLLGKFKDTHTGELPEQQAANLATLERLNAQLRLNSENQIRVIERRERLAARQAGVDGADSIAATGLTRLERLQLELEETRARFTDKYPDVIRLQAEIAALQAGAAEPGKGAAADRPSSGTGGGLRRIDAEIDALREEERILRRTIDQYQLRVENAPKREQDLLKLTQDYAAARELHSSLLKRYEEAQLAETLEGQKGEQFVILDPAVTPSEPSAPNRMRLLLMALVLSLAAAAAASMLAEQLDTSFHAAEDLRAFTRVPVLASIPRIPIAADAQRAQMHACVVAACVVIGIALVAYLARLVGHDNEQLVWLMARRGA